MIQGHTAEEILNESRDVIETNGEWELVDIKLAPNTLVLDEGTFSKVIYYVSIYNVQCTLFILIPHYTLQYIINTNRYCVLLLASKQSNT